MQDVGGVTEGGSASLGNGTLKPLNYRLNTVHLHNLLKLAQAKMLSAEFASNKADHRSRTVAGRTAVAYGLMITSMAHQELSFALLTGESFMLYFHLQLSFFLQHTLFSLEC